MSVTHLHGDCLDVLPTLHDKSVQCVVTSPPYWGLRDYGTAKWEGGDADCDHRPARLKQDRNENRPTFGDSYATHRTQLTAFGNKTSCDKCGATKTDSQLGLEKTPDEYVAKMVAVFREVKRVLRDDGTLWLNLGDSYNNVGGGNAFNAPAGSISGGQREAHKGVQSAKKWAHGLKVKDLCGIPWRVAFALQADGWYLRSDIIWHKPNPMPESVTDRPTKAHEYLFLLTKSASYFYDADAIAEEGVKPAGYDGTFGNKSASDRRVDDLTGNMRPGVKYAVSGKRNRRSVWTVATRPYKGAHFATFPPKLIEPCILAGSRPGDTVLDPFGGSGTTAAVAEQHGRDAILIELNESYIDLQRERMAKVQPALGVA